MANEKLVIEKLAERMQCVDLHLVEDSDGFFEKTDTFRNLSNEMTTSD